MGSGLTIKIATYKYRITFATKEKGRLYAALKKAFVKPH